MNLVLLWPDETVSGSVRLTDRRAEHLLGVLRVTTGQLLRAGVLDVGCAEARVVSTSAQAVELSIERVEPGILPTPKVLLLAAPRPKVASRCLQHVAALGFTDIFLFRSYRVDKSHLLSHKQRWPAQEQQLLLGLEQSRRVFLPRLKLFERFKPFVEDELPQLLPKHDHFVAHPGASKSTSALSLSSAAYSLAIGPEGGFIPYEIEALERAGFCSISAGPNPLRVESAISYLAGQLDLLGRVTGVTCH